MQEAIGRIMCGRRRVVVVIVVRMHDRVVQVLVIVNVLKPARTEGEKREQQNNRGPATHDHTFECATSNVNYSRGDASQ